MPFRYDTYTNPYVGSIAAAMGRQGEIAAQSATQIAEAQARARMVSGQAWGQAIQQAGQIPSQIMEQQRVEKDAAQRRQLQQAQIDEYGQRVKDQQIEQQRAVQGQQLLGQLHQQYGDDFEKVASGLADAGFGTEAEKYRTSGMAMQPYKDNINKHLALAIAGASKDAKDPGEALLNLDQFVAGGQITQQQRDTFAKTLASVQTPEDYTAWLKRTLDWADGVAGTKTLKAGDIEQGAASGRTLGSVPEKPTAETAKIDGYIASLGLPNGTKWETLNPEQRAGFKAYSEPAGATALHVNGEFVTKDGKPVLTNEKGDFFDANKQPLTPADVKRYQAPLQARDALTKVEHKDPITGKTVIEWLPQSQLGGRQFEKGVGGVLEGRLASAQAVNQTGQDIIAKVSDPNYAKALGAAMGRFSKLQDFIGNPPPEFAEIAGMIESYALANMGVHGMRSTQGAQKIADLLNQPHTPESIVAAIKGLNAFSSHFMENEGVKTPAAPNRIRYDINGNVIK